MVEADAAKHLTAELQWGHGREAMDGNQDGHRRNHDKELQWGHGREAMDGDTAHHALATAQAGFNGAMAVRPWMEHSATPSA